MDFQSYLKNTALEIEEKLNEFLENWSRETAAKSSKLSRLSQTFIEASQGGKRLRGVLVRLGYEMAGREYNPEILKGGVAYEIFQTAILAHDDIIDQSPLRRGKPTLWQALGGDHYGISQTICLGDIGFFLAYKLISESNFPEKEKNQAISIFTQTMLETALGEILDIELPHLKEVNSQKDVETIFRLKTAKYTLVGPLQLGVILGGGNNNLLDDIKRFGDDLGIAFQIQDDILGIFGDEKSVGKSVTSDAEEGKITLLYLHALKYGSGEQKGLLEKYYGKGKIGVIELEKIRKVFWETGALEACQKRAQELVVSAKKVIEGMEVSSEYKKLLMEMADFLVDRQK